MVERWSRGIDAQQDRAKPVLGVDAVDMELGNERAVHDDVLDGVVLSGD